MTHENTWNWVIYNSTELKITSRNDHRNLQRGDWGNDPYPAMPCPGRCPALTLEQLPQSRLRRQAPAAAGLESRPPVISPQSPDGASTAPKVRVEGSINTRALS